MIHIMLGKSLSDRLYDIVQYVRQYGGTEALAGFKGMFCAQDEKGNVFFQEAIVPSTLDDLNIGKEYCVKDLVALSETKTFDNGGSTDKYISAYFSDMYDKTLNINTTQNAFSILNVCFYFLSYDTASLNLAKRLIEAINNQNRNFSIDLFVLTADMAKVLEPEDQLDTLPERIEQYQIVSRQNIKDLLALKESKEGKRMAHMVVMQNCNNFGVPLNLDKASFVRTLGEYINTVQSSYSVVFNSNLENEDRPIHAFGLSALNLDKYYFVDYLLTKAYLSLLEQEHVDDTSVDVAEPRLEAQNRLSRWNHFYDSFYAGKVMPVINEKGADADADVNVEAGNILHSEMEIMEADVLSFINNKELTLPQKRIVLAQMLGMDDPLVSGSSPIRDALLFRDCYSDTINMFVKANNLLLEKEPSQLYVDIPTVDTDKPKNLSKEYPEELCLAEGAVLSSEHIPFEAINEELKATELKIRESTELIRNLSNQLNECQLQEDNALQKEKVLVEDGFRFGDVVYRLDAVEQIPLDEDYMPKSASLPKSVDLRQGFGEVRNQGPLGSCTAFALTGIVEYMLKKSGKPYHDLSELFLFYYTRYQERKRKGLSSLPPEKDGGSYFDAIAALSEYGICEETLWPYEVGKVDFNPSPEAVANAAKIKVVKAKNVKRNVADIKSALAEGYPVAVSVRLFESFTDERHGFVVLPSDDEIAEGKVKSGHDGHAMVICGYRDDQNIFIVRNSWGKEFGDRGYCFMPYAYFEDERLTNMACVVTELNDMSNIQTGKLQPKEAASFDLDNPNIRSGILRIKISVEKRRLTKLSKQRADLFEQYVRIETNLFAGNVWADLHDATKKRVEWEIGQIDEQEKANSKCESDRLDDLSKRRKKKILRTAVSYGVGLVVYMFLWLKHIVDPNLLFTCKLSKWIYGFALAGIVLFVIELIRFKKEQESIREEHDNIREKLARFRHLRTKGDKDDRSFLGLHLDNLKIRMYQAWLVFKDFSAQNRSFERKYQTMVSYVSNLQAWLEEERQKIVQMSPDDKFPFVSLLSNGVLDAYYESRKADILKGIQLSELFSSEYNLDDESIKIFKENLEKRLVKALLDDLDGFSLSNCLLNNKYDYIGKQEGLGLKLIPKLDQKSNPFIRQRFLATNPLVGKGETKVLFGNDIQERQVEWHENFDGSFTGNVKFESIDSAFKIVLFQMRTLPLDECEDIR